MSDENQIDPPAPGQESNTEVVAVVALRPNDVYTPFLWSRENLARWVSACVLCYIFYDLFTRGSDALRSFQGGNSILAILVLLAILILFGLLVFPYLRVYAAFRKSPYLRKARTYKFAPGGVKIESADTVTDCQWTLFRKIVETRKTFLLMYDGQAGAHLPKRCLRSPEEVQRLRQLIKEHAPPHWELRRD
jgi:YcxB-like protein